MIDPDRLIDAAGSPEARLLASALDEPPPADLLARTLVEVAAVGAAAPAAGAGAAAGAAAAKAAGGGILGAAAVGALAGVLVVAGYGLATSGGAKPSPDTTAAAITAPAHAGGDRPTAPAALPLPPREPDRAMPAAAPAPATGDAPTVASVARPSALAAEIELLDEASQALRLGNPARAQALLDRYARESPRGQLGREAAKLRAEVLVALRDGGGDPERTIP
jgi:hypothetical protein